MIDETVVTQLSDDALEATPIERAETIPSSWYTDARFHALDDATVFAHNWQCVGYRGQVEVPGDYFLANVAGNPIIVIRGKDRVLRAFYNVCRHRGGPLATEDGSCEVLQCKYHGWTYLLDGSLRGVPKFDRVELFDRKDYGLVPVQVECWEGLVFVNLADAARPLGDAIDGVKERMAPITIGNWQFAHRQDYDVRCNWKVYVDNYLEGYHIPFVHPELCKLYDYQKYVTEVHPTYSLQAAPLGPEDNIYSSGGGEAFYFFVFPNFMLNILPGRLQTNLVVPTAADRTRVMFWYFYEDVSSADAKRRIADDLAYSDRVQQEDIEICERVQEGLRSRAYDRGRFSVDQEQGVYDFQLRLKRTYREWRDRESG
ncbi:MAG: aromatic ring-hydroxylating dioxygenase subunit alpha [Gemmatimonadetes bacterium]|nr:aromatic ring-hydroxylating dioxygenase subunit alpha [Gemmatimonadota bacterium]